MMRNQYLTLLACVLCFISAFSQPGVVDLSFDPNAGANNTIRTVAIQTDGRIIIGGEFTAFNGTPVSYVARLLTTGSLDTTFHTGTAASATIYASAIQTDGKIIIGGDMISYNGTAVNHLARLNTDGSLDTTFSVGSGPNNNIKCLLIQPDGKIVAGGNFTSWSGNTRNRIARVNANGSLDAGFNPGSGANGTVESMGLQANGKIVIGGSFTSFGSNILLRLGRVNTDGSADNGFNTFLGGASSTVFAIAVQSDQHILIGGNFVNYNGNPVNRITRLNTDGGLDNSFGVGQGANSSVNAILATGSGDILIAGNFTSYNGTAVGRIARLSSSGVLDNSFNPLNTGADAEIISLALQSNGKIIIGGSFSNYGTVSRNKVARLYGCVTPKPGAIAGVKTTLCSGSVQTYSINPVSGADSYIWTLPSGWTGNSDSTSITATANGTGGIISVVAYNALCGYSAPQTDTVTKINAPEISICLVTVDSASTHNIIVWEKPQTTLIDSFFLYRETTTNNYTKIAAVPYDSLSEYHDYGADPNTTSYKYKLSVLDTCGVETAQSFFHNSIHLQYLSNGNLQWTLYNIENTGNPVNFYRVYRDNLGNGNFVPISTTIPGNNFTYTDVNYNSFANAIYVLDVDWSISCTPTRAISTTRSNIKHLTANPDTFSTGIIKQLESKFIVYPNPAFETITISNQTSITVTGIDILNMQGIVLYHDTPSFNEYTLSTKAIDVKMLAKGVYIIRLDTDSGKIIKKLIIQ